MHQVEITYQSPSIHLNQVISGFFLLHKQKKINLTVKYGAYNAMFPFLFVNANGKKLVYDMADRSAINEEFYANCDFYFKRMCLKTDLEKFSKLHPYGFNYSCYVPGLNFLKINFKIMPKFSIGSYTKLLKYIPFLSGLFKIANALSNTVYTKFEQAPNKRNFHIIFSARLWDPQKNENPLLQVERKKINAERVELVRNLHREFGNEYTGGIQDSYIVKSLAPDTIIPSKLYYKPNYLKNLKNSTIAIATAGLEDSIGFKFGEYIAASAVVLTTSDFELYAFPGNFNRNQNYLIYKTEQECINMIKDLKHSAEKMHAIMENNYAYYNAFLRPDKLILNTLEKTIN